MPASRKQTKTADDGSLRRFAKINLAPIGSTGLKVWAGVVDEEFLQALSQLPRRVAIYKEMSKDATVGAVLFAIKMLIRQADWEVKPATDERADIPAAEFLEECIGDMASSWASTLSSFLSFLVYGFSPHELVYKYRRGRQKGSLRSKYDDNRIGWRSMPVRAQETIQEWHMEDGDVVAVTQSAPPDYATVQIPEERLMIFRTEDAKGNPEGESILRTAYEPWYRKKHMQRVEGTGVERDLVGTPKITVPAEMFDQNAPPEVTQAFSDLQELGANLRNDERSCVIFPAAFDDNGNKLWDIDLMGTGSRRLFDTNAIIGRLKQEIAMATLADFMMVGHEKVGSYSLLDVKTKLFAMAVGAWLDEIERTFNRIAVERLIDLNAFDTRRGYPYIQHGDIESISLEELGNFISSVTGAGMPLFPNKAFEDMLMARMGATPQPE